MSGLQRRTHAERVRGDNLTCVTAFGNRVRLLLAISMPQDGSMMLISFVPLKEIVKAPGTSDL
jgi:hypothetical protein